MSDIKQICMHFLNGNCKYGDRCTKIHINSSPELLLDIDKKGTAICTYFPNCKFSSDDCKRIHVVAKNNGDINEFKNYYCKILEINTTDPGKLCQIDRVKRLVKHDLDFLKETYDCIR